MQTTRSSCLLEGPLKTGAKLGRRRFVAINLLASAPGFKAFEKGKVGR